VDAAPPAAAAPRALEWKAFRPPDGFCSVEMPGTPAPQEVPNNPGQVYYGVLLDDRGQEYGLSWFKVKRADAADPGFLGRFSLILRDRLATQHEGKGLPVRAVPGAVPCRELQVDAKGRVILIRAYLVKADNEDRLYQLLVTGPDVKPDSPDVTRFFKSFQVSRPQQVAPKK
jgi:hypothetical protein